MDTGDLGRELATAQEKSDIHRRRKLGSAIGTGVLVAMTLFAWWRRRGRKNEAERDTSTADA